MYELAPKLQTAICRTLSARHLDLADNVQDSVAAAVTDCGCRCCTFPCTATLYAAT